MELLTFIFFLMLFLIFHSYFGYPVSLLLIERVIKKKEKIAEPEHFEPNVSYIISVHNEENRIIEKLENTLKLDYKKEKLECVVVSDGSTDKTNEYVKKYEKHGIKLLETHKRSGKENAQKEAIGIVNGDIVVFSDVATILDRNGITEIISSFRDRSVGCVSSEDVILDQDNNPSGEGIYIKYEMWLRNIESRVNSLVGLSGSFFAARKEVLKDFSGDMQSDFKTLLNSIKLGLRGISNPKARGYYKSIADEKKEYERKVRTVLRGITVFFNHLELLNPRRYGFFSYQFLCHKFLRWMIPWFAVILLLINIPLLFSGYFFKLTIILQLFFYVAALIGHKFEKLNSIILIKIPYFFSLANFAILHAWIKFFKGEQIVMWTPSKR
ncbi:MAG: glycosyltransferase family 2 protein [Calditrichae bacterium]|nr:glycosyltransferase family 2 protein [Calditrichota bacterium]MCB9059537.1 glycosyltransferase family 2 protein [Calditrichia bacterium]